MSKLLKTMGVERRGVSASCFPLVMFLLTLCVVAGIKIVRSGHRSLVETAEICERLEKRGLRFEARQAVIDNACHIFGGNYAGTSGNGTSMCIYVHPEDCPEAERIIHL